MAIVKPFKGVRPTRDKVALVSSKSYDLYSQEELEAKLNFNPFTFLHVIKPNSQENQDTVISNKEHFKLIRHKYSEFKKDAILSQDSIPSFYIYKKKTINNEYCGIIATTSVDDFYNSVIKKHEATLHKRELLFKKYLKTTKFNAEPVLLTYPDNDSINEIINTYKKRRPEYEFSTSDKDLHLLWVVDNSNDVQLITKYFKEVPALYIADGHHRSTSSCLLAKSCAKQNPNHTGEEAYNFFMSFLLADSQLTIYEFNRFIKDLNGLTVHEFLTKLDLFYTVENKGQIKTELIEKHQFNMYLNGDFYLLTLKKTGYNFTDALSNLDAQILYTTILKPILGIHDIRNTSQITYSQNKLDSLELKNLVDTGDFSISFGMMPTHINELKEIANAGLLMPPKTTYIEPKLRSGLTIYEF